MDNYVVYHLHSDLSNGVTNIDSVTKYSEYIAKAKECGMKALGFSEHGSVFEWYHKKCDIEAAGMKYLHGIEAYITADLNEKFRDNYHCVLIARNYDGFLELNQMVSRSFNRTDGHFYYTPRITFEELYNTSDNILITSACVGGVLGKNFDYSSDNDPFDGVDSDGFPIRRVDKYHVKEKFVEFFTNHKDRCFFEIGHHIDDKQCKYNRELLNLSEQTGVRLIAGTDTHVLNKSHEEGRLILQRAKHIEFPGEENWDLKFKTFSGLVSAYEQQGVLPSDVYLRAIDNTNVLADMVEPFTLDTHTKYPHMYDDPEETFRKKVFRAAEKHPYAFKNHNKDDVIQVINEELDVYKATESIDFMLLQTYLREWEKANGIKCGYGRGSVSGSMVAYVLGITQMDSMRFGLNFFRFMNPDRVTNADIDTDYSGKDRDRVKEFLLRDKMGLSGINSAEIITFNTIALKGAIEDVCRALYKEKSPETYLKITDEIKAAAESDEADARRRYAEVFKYVDIVNGTIVSIGTHPSGVLISDLPIDETVGLCTTSKSEYPVSMINMKELDDLMYVKLDILGLDNIGIINDTCETLGIDRLTPDNVDLDDDDVWQSIIDDTTLIFQWESNSAQQYLRRFMSDMTLSIAKEKVPSFSMIKWLSFGNGLIRPSCASFRDTVADGEFYDNGFDELNEFLSPEAGRLAMQETIMQFLVKFCGYSNAESDTVRRGIAKKKGTETLLPEIERRFIEYSSKHYDITEERCIEVIKPFLQIIKDASAYGFSWNHSDAYSCIGYISGYLRYYYPGEFLTSSLNIFDDNMEKTADITKYAAKRGIKIVSPKWGMSRGKYSFDKEANTIAKGLGSVKYLNERIADELYDIANNMESKSFIDVLKSIGNTGINSRQLDILIKIDFFSDFGNQRELIRITEIYNDMFKKGTAKKLTKSKIEGTPLEEIVAKYAIGKTKAGTYAKSYTLLDIDAILYEAEEAVKNAGLPELEAPLRVQNFVEVMGYVGYISGKDEDRSKLYIMDTHTLRRKKDNKQFGYSVITKSIGSGIETRFTVYNRVYKQNPVKEGDVIECLGWEREGKYFAMTAYKKIG